MNKRIKTVLTDLESVREDLLALAEAVWRGIDPRNAEQRERVMRLNAKADAFDALAGELSTMIQEFTQIRLGDRDSVMEVDEARAERIIRELDRATPHTLEEDFTYKRPYGFVLRGRAFTDMATWKQLYQSFCQQLARLDAPRFDALPNNPIFVSSHDHRAFSPNPGDLREPLSVAHGIFAESHYSANSFRDNMRRLVDIFEMQPDQLTIYLRQDRDAGGDGVA